MSLQSKQLLDSYCPETDEPARTETTLLSLAFANLLSFRGAVAVPMAPTVLQGPNASGKSSLFYIVAYVLYGEYAAFICNNQETDAYGEMTFAVDGETYRIRREISAGVRVRGVLTGISDPADGRKKRKLPAARKAMETLLGVDFTQFVALNTLRAPFADMTPAALRAVFVKQVGLKRYDSAFRAVNADIKAFAARAGEIGAVLEAAEITPSDFRDREALHRIVAKCYVDGTRRVTDAYARFDKFRKFADMDVSVEMKRLKADRAVEVADLLPRGCAYSYEALEEMIAVRATQTGPSLKAQAGQRDPVSYSDLERHFETLGGTWDTAAADIARLKAQKNHVASVENIAAIDADLAEIRAYVGVAAAMETAEAQIRGMRATVAANTAAQTAVTRMAIAAELMEIYGQITPERHAELSAERADLARKLAALQALVDDKTAIYDDAAAEYTRAVVAAASEATGFAVDVRGGALVIDAGRGAVGGAYASGYERARAEIALRLAMHRLSGAPVVHFLFADETLDCFDAAHAHDVPPLFAQLLAFGAVFVVAHSVGVQASVPQTYMRVSSLQ